MNRRGFFKAAVKKSSKAVVNEASTRARKKASRWIRPPYVIEELDFLFTCTRCGECIEACPHQVVFILGSKLGAAIAGTPALDLLNKGCHLCSEWPCVAACKPGALAINETTTNKLSNVSINPQQCLPYSGPECGVCIESCPVPNALLLELTRPVIDDTLCLGCGLCREACITSPKAIDIRSLHA